MSLWSRGQNPKPKAQAVPLAIIVISAVFNLWTKDMNIMNEYNEYRVLGGWSLLSPAQS